MSRRTYPQYREVHPPRPRKFTFEEVLGYLKRQMKRKMIADGLIIDPKIAPPKYHWDWQYEGSTGVVTANTRGEARACIKRDLSLSRNKRLPMGITITRRDNDERCAYCVGASA